MSTLLAVALGGWSVVDVAIAVVVVAAIVGLVYVALDQFGVAIPPVVVKVFWIVLVAVLVIFAIRLVAEM